ncbi:hypothetical protein CI41S_30450 [Bradyrhizobium ivorense]|nr:hypothetical protein CI41S_30450 [Bradyrhizobium ivorense]
MTAPPSTRPSADSPSTKRLRLAPHHLCRRPREHRRRRTASPPLRTGQPGWPFASGNAIEWLTDAACYEAVCQKVWFLSTKRTRQAVCATPAIAPGLVRRIRRKRGSSAASIATNRNASRCRSGDVSANPLTLKRAPISNMSPRLRRAMMDQLVRTCGPPRMPAKIGLASLVYNIKRTVFLCGSKVGGSH